MINDLKSPVSPIGVKKKKKKELRLREVPTAAQGHTARSWLEAGRGEARLRAGCCGVISNGCRAVNRREGGRWGKCGFSEMEEDDFSRCSLPRGRG